ANNNEMESNRRIVLKSVAQPPQPPEVPHSPARLILPLHMPLQIGAIEINIPQPTRAILLSLIVKVRRRYVPTLATSRHSLRPHPLSKLNHRNKTIPTSP